MAAINRYVLMVVILLAGSLLYFNNGWAESVRLKSKISEVNTEGGFLKIYRIDPQTEKNDEIRLDVDMGTRFSGIESLRDLKKDDEIFAETNYDAYSHSWKAIEITKTVGL